jgi:DNA polymerase-3 subunit epsilon
MTATLVRKGEVGQPTANAGHFAAAPARDEAPEGLLGRCLPDRRTMTVGGITRFMVFDTETTGIDVDGDRVVSAYCGIMDADGNLVSSKTWLINPGVNIPEAASAVHGISNEKARAEGMDSKEAIGEIARALDWCIANGVPVAAYNASFDISILDAELRRHYSTGFPVGEDGPVVIDPYVMDKALDKYRKGSRKLTDTAVHYGVELENAHEAEGDAVATGRVAWKLLAMDDDKSLHDLMVDQQGWAAEQAESFQDFLRRTRDPEAVIDGSWPARTAAVAAA